MFNLNHFFTVIEKMATMTVYDMCIYQHISFPWRHDSILRDSEAPWWYPPLYDYIVPVLFFSTKAFPWNILIPYCHNYILRARHTWNHIQQHPVSLILALIICYLANHLNTKFNILSHLWQFGEPLEWKLDVISLSMCWLSVCYSVDLDIRTELLRPFYIYFWILATTLYQWL